MAGFDDEVRDDFVEGADGFGERRGLVAEGVESGFYCWGVLDSGGAGCWGGGERGRESYVRFGNSAGPYGGQRERVAPSFFCDVSEMALPRLLPKQNAGADGAGVLCSRRILLHRWKGRGG